MSSDMSSEGKGWSIGGVLKAMVTPPVLTIVIYVFLMALGTMKLVELLDAHVISMTATVAGTVHTILFFGTFFMNDIGRMIAKLRRKAA